jgi:hypothetical protein
MDKQRAVTNHLDACISIVQGWNDPGRPIVIQPDRTEGSITYTHAPSSNFNHAINTHFNGQLTNNRRSFIDACWIKLYNGRGDNHYYWLEQSNTDDKNNVIPPTWYICDFAKWSGGVNYYVRDISARNTP